MGPRFTRPLLGGNAVYRLVCSLTILSLLFGYGGPALAATMAASPDPPGDARGNAKLTPTATPVVTATAMPTDTRRVPLA